MLCARWREAVVDRGIVFENHNLKLLIMKNLSAHLALFASNLIWACAYPVYNFLMPKYIEPLPLFTAIMSVTALISVISMLCDRNKASLRIERHDIVAVIVAALLITTLRKGLLIYGLSITSPIDGSIISTTTPVVVMVISILIGFEVFSKRRALGVILGLGGAVGVILTGGDSHHAHSTVEGNLMILGCATISAIYVLWFKSLLRRYRPMVILQWMFCITAVIVIPFGLGDVVRVDTSGWSWRVWLAVGYLLLLPTYLPNILLSTALKRVTPTVASIYTYVQPIFAVSISVATGLDKLHFATVLCAVLIFAGVGVVISSTKSGS